MLLRDRRDVIYRWLVKTSQRRSISLSRKARGKREARQKQR